MEPSMIFFIMSVHRIDPLFHLSLQRFPTHLKHQLTSLDEVAVKQVVIAEELPVYGHLLDVDIPFIVVLYLDYQLLVIRKLYGGFLYRR